jgi:hypothetical protein
MKSISKRNYGNMVWLKRGNMTFLITFSLYTDWTQQKTYDTLNLHKFTQ